MGVHLTNIRKDIFNKVIQLPIGFFSNEKKYIMSRMTNDVNAIEISILSMMELGFSYWLLFYFTLLYLSLISFKLFLFLTSLLPVVGSLIWTHH